MAGGEGDSIGTSNQSIPYPRFQLMSRLLKELPQLSGAEGDTRGSEPGGTAHPLQAKGAAPKTQFEREGFATRPRISLAVSTRSPHENCSDSTSTRRE